jgi:ribosomal protein S18 acetylase RimI-like enzyme
VWQINLRAITFYERAGFARVGEQTFMLGDDPQTDFVLARPVS